MILPNFPNGIALATTSKTAPPALFPRLMTRHYLRTSNLNTLTSLLGLKIVNNISIFIHIQDVKYLICFNFNIHPVEVIDHQSLQSFFSPIRNLHSQAIGRLGQSPESFLISEVASWISCFGFRDDSDFPSRQLTIRTDEKYNKGDVFI